MGTVAKEETIGVAQSPMNFGGAVAALNEGKMVFRAGWNGKGLFIFRQVPSVVPQEFVHKMSSLPTAVKAEFKARFEAGASDLSYSDQLALVKKDNSIQGWSPSTADAMAHDWLIY